MPNYNRAATLYWWLVVVLGHVLLGALLVQLSMQPWPVLAQVAVGVLLAVGSGLFPVRVPGTINSFAAGEVVIFLVLLLHGPAAAAVVAAAESGVGAWRTSRRWTSRISSPALATLAMSAAGWLFDAGRQALAARGLEGPAPLLGLAMGVALVYFVISSALYSGVSRFNRGERFFRLADLVSAFRWVGLAYAGSAALAVLLFIAYRLAGGEVLLVMVPLLAMMLVTLHFYFRQQEATESARRAQAEGAEREAALLAREAEAAAQHLRELEASERRFHSAFTHAAIGMALLDFDGRIVKANAALASLLGTEAAALEGVRLHDRVHGNDREAFASRLAQLGAIGRSDFALELRLTTPTGAAARWASLHCGFFTEPDAATPCLIVQLHDVSARRQAEAGLEHLAFHDSLTGLPNRRRLLDCLASSLARAERDPRHAFAVLFLDFDRFKLVNDSLGHSAGDELLVQLARRLQERLRPADVLARLGGDEFALIADRVEHPRDATLLAERLLAALAPPFLVAGHEVGASASIGITYSHLGYRSAEELLRDADTAMYKAKALGKARYAVFDASLHTEVSRRLRLEGDLRRAIDAGHLAVAYQPLFELGRAGGSGAGRLLGFEALLRWNHPQDGELAPLSFLPMAEESGLMPALSDFVLHCACRQLREWQLLDPSLAELTMSVNVAADDIGASGFVARVTRAVIEAGLRPQHLVLELTENILMSRLAGGIGALTELRRLGVHVAVDDFGTGYSSLSHLAKLPIDSLKIDKSFVGHLEPGSDEAAVVAAIIRLGQSLRKSIVAEGIESAEQLQALRALGCTQGQGHHLSVPLTAAAASTLLREQAGRQGSPLH
jgi:diguanylate cyclase (GGDEF)-like protein/PAS domain S-box-containing protein